MLFNINLTLDVYDKILIAYYFTDINQSEIADFVGCNRDTWNRGFKKKALSEKHLKATLEFFKSRKIDIEAPDSNEILTQKINELSEKLEFAKEQVAFYKEKSEKVRGPDQQKNGLVDSVSQLTPGQTSTKRTEKTIKQK